MQVVKINDKDYFVIVYAENVTGESDSDSSEPSSTTWIRSLSLSVDEKETLTEGKWLTANHISAGQQLLHRSFPHQNGLKDTSYLSEKMMWSSKPKDFVQVIHVAGCHWACLSNIFCPPNSVELYDSMHTLPTPNGSIVKQACAIMFSKDQSLTFNVVNVQYQSGCSDCGLFSLAMAFDLCNKEDPVFKDYDQTQLRAHLKNSFETETITSFPGKRSKRKKRVVEQIELDIHCLCRQPEEGLMLCCDRCDTWYHSHCIRMPAEVHNPEAKWICQFCQS